MVNSLARESDSSAKVNAARRIIRIMLWALAVAAILFCSLCASLILYLSLGLHGNDRIYLLSFFPVLSLVMLFQFLSGRAVSVGWIVGAALCGALLACMVAPTISHVPLRDLWGTQYAFWGAVVGTAAGTVVCFLLVRVRIHHLLELTLACALVGVFWTLYVEADARNKACVVPLNKLVPGLTTR
jgi:hypothetical protein